MLTVPLLNVGLSADSVVNDFECSLGIEKGIINALFWSRLSIVNVGIYFW